MINAKCGIYCAWRKGQLVILVNMNCGIGKTQQGINEKSQVFYSRKRGLMWRS